MDFLPTRTSAICGYEHEAGLLPKAVYIHCVYRHPKHAGIPMAAAQRHQMIPSWSALKKNNGGLSGRSISEGLRATATVNGSPGRYKTNPKEVIMVEPLEAKRLAAVQMEQLQAESKNKRQRKIEAVNGAWAMLGLTAGLVIEGYTGNGILLQLASYFNALAGFLDKYIPS